MIQLTKETAIIAEKRQVCRSELVNHFASWRILHQEGRGGQPLGDMGIVLLARYSDYFCDLWKTCKWSETASQGYIVLTLTSESDSARSLAVCKQFCISLNSTPKTSGRTDFCRRAC